MVLIEGGAGRESAKQSITVVIIGINFLVRLATFSILFPFTYFSNFINMYFLS